MPDRSTSAPRCPTANSGLRAIPLRAAASPAYSGASGRDSGTVFGPFGPNPAWRTPQNVRIITAPARLPVRAGLFVVGRGEAKSSKKIDYSTSLTLDSTDIIVEI